MCCSSVLIAPLLTRLLSVLAAQSKVEFSLRAEPGVSSKDRKGSAAKKAEAGEEPTKGGALRLRDLQKGQKVKGFVRAITDFGVFVQIEGSDVSGLAHKSQVSSPAAVVSYGADAFTALGQQVCGRAQGVCRW